MYPSLAGRMESRGIVIMSKRLWRRGCAIRFLCMDDDAKTRKQLRPKVKGGKKGEAAAAVAGPIKRSDLLIYRNWPGQEINFIH